MSLTSVVCKLLETLIRDHMVEFLVKHKLINTFQHGFLLKFADDTKVFRKVTNDTDKHSLQDDLDKLVKCSEKMQMLFNFRKYKCIHIGHGTWTKNIKWGMLY